MKGTREISRDALEIERFRVEVVRGPDAPRAIVSDGLELTVGTDGANHLQLSDAAVSRHHCMLTVTPFGVELRDLDSTNGTTLGGFRVNSAYVRSGSLIAVGETQLRVELLGEHLDEPLSPQDRFGPVIGTSRVMRRLFAILERVAPSDATVLLEGETGTGKGLLAEAIHEDSPRSNAPFVVIDCAAIPPQLIESELFGHEAGAFTGARDERMGLFESASGGTIFLDEVGELPLDLQPKLLRALENRVIRRVGSHTPRPVDIRVIAATNRDLRREVNRGGFRADLWYRLSTVRLVVPPLRERREDIPLLVAHFYRQMADDDASGPPPDLVAAMRLGEWRGNVRELASAVERALVFDDPDTWSDSVRPNTHDDSGFDVDLNQSFRAAKMRATASWERTYLRQLMSVNEGNISRAARAARMDRSYLRELLRRYGLPGGQNK